MNLNDIAKRAHNDAKSMGWYEKGKIKSDLESLMMVVSEISEAVEELRKPQSYPYYKNPGVEKPEGWGVEIADAVIRLLDFAEYKGLDLEQLIREKLNYNLSRGHRHGGKKF